MTAQERITEWAELAGNATEPLPDNARMDAYYYGFSSTGSGAVDAVLSAVAIAGKWAHGTETWQEVLYGTSCESLIQEAANDSAKRLAVVDKVPAMAAALTAVLAMETPSITAGLSEWDRGYAAGVEHARHALANALHRQGREPGMPHD